MYESFFPSILVHLNSKNFLPVCPEMGLRENICDTKQQQLLFNFLFFEKESISFSRSSSNKYFAKISLMLNWKYTTYRLSASVNLLACRPAFSRRRSVEIPHPIFNLQCLSLQVFFLKVQLKSSNNFQVLLPQFELINLWIQILQSTNNCIFRDKPHLFKVPKLLRLILYSRFCLDFFFILTSNEKNLLLCWIKFLKLLSAGNIETIKIVAHFFTLFTVFLFT